MGERYSRPLFEFSLSFLTKEERIESEKKSAGKLNNAELKIDHNNIKIVNALTASIHK